MVAFCEPKDRKYDCPSNFWDVSSFGRFEAGCYIEVPLINDFQLDVDQILQANEGQR